MHGAEIGAEISLMFCIPFVGMLLSIAICPLAVSYTHLVSAEQSAAETAGAKERDQRSSRK